MEEEEKVKKREFWIWVIIALASTFAIILVITSLIPKTEADEKTAKCIGGNSTLYTQLGCSHCEKQEELFGNNYAYLNIIDCWYNLSLCTEITGTPTWMIKGEQYKGLKTIDELKELTGC